MTICRDCGDSFSIPRYNLGYRTCLSCGDKQARAVTFCTVPMNKSAYMLITNPTELKQLNPKRVGE